MYEQYLLWGLKFVKTTATWGYLDSQAMDVEAVTQTSTPVHCAGLDEHPFDVAGFIEPRRNSARQSPGWRTQSSLLTVFVYMYI